VIEPSKKCDFTMRIFNADGSEAEMCGNGARCVGLWAVLAGSAKRRKEGRVRLEYNSFETAAGPIEVRVLNKKKAEARVNVQLSDVVGARLNIPLEVLGRKITVHYINTGVPHTIVFVEGLENIAVSEIGREIRFHKKFSPYGTNVDFVEVTNENAIRVRTYERGVEGETEACGTGLVASSIMFKMKYGEDAGNKPQRVTVGVKNGEKLNVSFRRRKQVVYDVWFEGKAYLVYKGEYLLHR